jgi:hypothetical protein
VYCGVCILAIFRLPESYPEKFCCTVAGISSGSQSLYEVSELDFDVLTVFGLIQKQGVFSLIKLKLIPNEELQ